MLQASVLLIQTVPLTKKAPLFALSLSYQRLYYDNTTTVIFNELTAIIYVDEGIVSYIAWDYDVETMMFCDKKRSEEKGDGVALVGPGSLNYTFNMDGGPVYIIGQQQGNVNEEEIILNDDSSTYDAATCPKLREECSSSGSSEASSNGNCDLAIRVIWTGTDSNGDSFQSIDQLLQGGNIQMSNYRSPTYLDANVLGSNGRGVVYSHEGILDVEYGGGFQKFSVNHFPDMSESDMEFMSRIEYNGTTSYNYPARLISTRNSDSSSSSGSTTTALVPSLLFGLMIFTGIALLQ